MPAEAFQANQSVNTIILISVIAFFLALRFRRVSKARLLKLEQLWIFPSLCFVLAAVILYQFPPTGLQWLLCGVFLLLGLMLGWQRGRTMQIHVDPETHLLNQRASPAALLFLLLIIGVRIATRELIGAQIGPFLISARLIVDLLMLMALGLFTAQRVEMYLRARRLLDQAHAVQGS